MTSKRSRQKGSAALFTIRGTHVPVFVLESTSQHIAPRRQSSSPAVGPSGVVQASPGARGRFATGRHRVPVQTEPPSTAAGMHLSPAGQSCVYRLHAKRGRPGRGSVPTLESRTDPNTASSASSSPTGGCWSHAKTTSATGAMPYCALRPGISPRFLGRARSPAGPTGGSRYQPGTRGRRGRRRVSSRRAWPHSPARVHLRYRQARDHKR